MKKANQILVLMAGMLIIPWVIYSQGCETPSADQDGVKLFGFFQPQYDYTLSDPNTSTFKFKRARIGVMGNIPYDFSYYVVIENSAFVSQTGYPYLLDAYISYTRLKWATISVGSFKQPFGLDVTTACSGLPAIERSFVADQLVAPQRDMGIMLLGGDNTTKIRYSLAVMNGRGLSVKDNNNKKDIIGRVIVKPFSMLSLGASFRYGFPNLATADRLSFGGDFVFTAGEFTLQGEYIYDKGDYSRAAGGGCGAEPVALGEKRDGGYILAMYKTKWNLQPVARMEFFDADKASDNNEIYNMTFGLNYFFNDWTRLQFNYMYKAEKGAEVPNDALMVQVQVKF